MSDAPTEAVQAIPTLYETDFSAWLNQTAQLLREKRFTEIDIDNLIEEIDSLSRRDKRELRSRLIALLSHLLKYRYQPENRSQSWLSTIAEQRRQIELILEDSPSLKIQQFSVNSGQSSVPKQATAKTFRLRSVPHLAATRCIPY